MRNYHLYVLRFATVILVCIVSTANAQMSDIWLQSGSSHQQVTIGNLEDFRKIAPTSRLLLRDLNEFSYSDFSGRESMQTASVYASFPLRGAAGKNRQSELRFGFSYRSGVLLSGGLHRKIEFPFDTLSSSQTGQVYFVDSVQSESYIMEYSAEQIGLDVAWITRTNSGSRWSFYTGLGVSAGVTFNAVTEVLYSRHDGTEIRNLASSPGTFNGVTDSFTGSAEVIRGRSGVTASVYMPLGVDFRLGNESPFWKRMHLFAEIRPNLNIADIPELRSIVSGSVQVSFGLRLSLGE